MGLLDIFKRKNTITDVPFKTAFGDNLQFAPKQQFQIGQTIAGEYKVQDVFGGEGQSGMGVVYLVTAQDYPFPFILKTIQLEENNKLSFQRFTKEAEAWIRVGVHPNIVKALWVRNIEDLLYVAAEYVAPDSYNRNTLTQFIFSTEIPSQIILRWAAQFCYGMQHALERGLISHRDIKPDNLLIDNQGNLKITDFGLAQLPSGTNSLPKDKNCQLNYNFTLAGSILGTLPYMAPEQFVDSSSVDHKADIYAFGIILYQMVNRGVYPYHLDNQNQNQLEVYAQAHINNSVNTFNSPFKELIYGCLVKDSKNRISSYAEILHFLSSISKNEKSTLPKKPNVKDSSVEELYIKAQSYVSLKQPEKALEFINKYLEHNTEAYWAWTEKGRILYELERFQKSITATEQSILIFPENSHSWNNLGTVLKSINKINKAQMAFRNALKYDSQNIAAMMNYCQVLEQLGEDEKILELLLIAIEIAPNKKALIFNAGNHAASFIKKRKTNLALPLLLKITEFEKNNPVYWQNLAIIYQSSGKRLNARESLNKLLRLEPQNLFALFTLSQLYAEESMFEEAIDCCEKVISTGNELVKAVSFKSQLLMHKGEIEEAIYYLKGVLRKYQNTDALWFILADIQEKVGDIQGAYNSINKCHQIIKSSEKQTDIENIKMIELKIKQLQTRIEKNT